VSSELAGILPNALIATIRAKAYFMIRSDFELSSQQHAAAAVPPAVTLFLWRHFA
jgi:hypothetical protein